MAQRVPEFQFDKDALKVRPFLYDYWCARGVGPNRRAVHEARGFPAAYPQTAKRLRGAGPERCETARIAPSPITGVVGFS